MSIASAFGFLLGFAIIARFASGLVRRLLDAESDELLIVCVVGLVVLAAGVAEEVGVSDAIAALLVGLVVAETGLTRRVEHLVLPLRDTFGAIFFFVFGVSIQPDLIVDVLGPILIAVVVSLVGERRRRARGRAPRRAVAPRGPPGRAHRARARRVLADPRRARDRGRPRRHGSPRSSPGYVLVLSLLAPVLATHADRIARGFGRKDQTADVIRTGGIA